eukprot:10805-Heterococcus_DN1.PRE.1
MAQGVLNRNLTQSSLLTSARDLPCLSVSAVDVAVTVAAVTVAVEVPFAEPCDAVSSLLCLSSAASSAISAALTCSSVETMKIAEAVKRSISH